MMRALSLARPLASSASVVAHHSAGLRAESLSAISCPPSKCLTVEHKNNTTTRYLHSSPSNQEGDLEDLCKKHIQLPRADFARGCVFLQQVALGNMHEVQRTVEELNGTGNIVNFRDYDRRSPLHLAASEGHLEMVKYLVKMGAKINRSDRWGNSPIDDSYRHKHFAVLEFLRENGGTFGSTSQATNFIAAAYEGDLHEVQTLYQLGSIDLDAQDFDKRTALHISASRGNADVVRFLCVSGASVNVPDRWNRHPLDEAQLNGHAECTEILKKYGAESATSVEASLALLDLFQKYSEVRDGVRSLAWHDVQSLLKDFGQEATDDHVRELFRTVDKDGKGYIEKDEFLMSSDLFLQGRPAGIILIVGGPGSGKGLLSERLVKECGVVHLSSGDLLREEVKAGTRLGKEVDGIMKRGGLISSAIMVALMQKRMKDHPGKRILLDGFPRSAENAKDLVTLCGRPELALHLDCDDTVLIERILARGKSGTRSDDNIQTALQRIRTYHKFHNTTIEFLRQEHVPVVNLDCSAPPEGVWAQLTAISRLMRKTLWDDSTLDR